MDKVEYDLDTTGGLMEVSRLIPFFGIHIKVVLWSK